MPPPDEGWAAVFNGVSLPAGMLGLLTILIKGPTLLRLVTKEWRGEAAEDRREVDAERDKIGDWKDRELERLRSTEERLSRKRERLLGRVHQLMDALDWWRDYAREQRHARLNDRQQHVIHETKASIEPLVLPDLPPLPLISEQADAAEYEDD